MPNNFMEVADFAFQQQAQILDSQYFEKHLLSN